jgi:hypothetical protein
VFHIFGWQETNQCCVPVPPLALFLHESTHSSLIAVVVVVVVVSFIVWLAGIESACMHQKMMHQVIYQAVQILTQQGS